MLPCSGLDLWPEIGLESFLPLLHEKQLGRPQKKRRNDPNKVKYSYKFQRRNTSATCSRYGEAGYNTRACRGQTSSGNFFSLYFHQ